MREFVWASTDTMGWSFLLWTMWRWQQGSGWKSWLINFQLYFPPSLHRQVVNVWSCDMNERATPQLLNPLERKIDGQQSSRDYVFGFHTFTTLIYWHKKKVKFSRFSSFVRGEKWKTFSIFTRLVSDVAGNVKVFFSLLLSIASITFFNWSQPR